MPTQSDNSRTVRWPGTGWTIRISNAPILKNSDNSVSEYSSGAWKRELHMTTVAGQSLPGATFGGNSLELTHEPSGARISFCALEALRAWQLLECKPIPHLAAHAYPPAWDYSFTTSYPGSTTTAVDAVDEQAASAAARPDGNSVHSRAAVDLAEGQATLRKPLCKCRGSAGREALISLEAPVRNQRRQPQQKEPEEDEERWRVASEAGAAHSKPPQRVAQRVTTPPPPEWLPCGESINLEALLLSLATPPALVETLELWKDDLEPHSFSFLRVRVLVAEPFWVVRLRCYVKVNGVRARLVDTCYVCHRATSHRVVRQQTWREGDWEALAGVGAPAHLGFDEVGEQVASTRLPHLCAPRSECLDLGGRGSCGERNGDGVGRGGDGGLPGGSVSSLAEDVGWTWRRSDLQRCEALSAGGGVAVAIVQGGLCVEAFAVAGRCVSHERHSCAGMCGEGSAGKTLWRRYSDEHLGGAAALAAAVAPGGRGGSGSGQGQGRGGGRLLAIGTDRGHVHIWCAATADPIFTFTLPHLPSRAVSHARDHGGNGSASVARWVELLAWSADGRFVAAAAGCETVVLDVTRLGGVTVGGVTVGGVTVGGVTVARRSMSGTVYALDFVPPPPLSPPQGMHSRVPSDQMAVASPDGGGGGSSSSGRGCEKGGSGSEKGAHATALAIGAYGGVGWLVVSGAELPDVAPEERAEITESKHDVNEAASEDAAALEAALCAALSLSRKRRWR